ncbi:MAG: hypothetical protein ACLR6J_05535 [Parabacteroides merdae]
MVRLLQRPTSYCKKKAEGYVIPFVRTKAPVTVARSLPVEMQWTGQWRWRKLYR